MKLSMSMRAMFRIFLAFAAATGGMSISEWVLENKKTFGVSTPNLALSSKATTILQQTGQGCTTHVWATAGGEMNADVDLVFYVDGEAQPSVRYNIALASASPTAAIVGFEDNSAPWGNRYFGHGSNRGGWYNNVRIPFNRSLRVDALAPSGSGAAFIIVRGLLGGRVIVGGQALPLTAKLRLLKLDAVTVGAFDMIPIVNISSGAGLIFMHSIFVRTGSECFLEGCFHLLADGEAFPGTTLSTGGEDFYDSAYYFAAGQYHMPVSGLTHLNTTQPYGSDGPTQFSAYRIHDEDPLVFHNGVQLLMRNGEVFGNPAAPDPLCTSPECSRHYKCFNLQKPPVAPGICTKTYNVTESVVTAYAWVYLFEDIETSRSVVPQTEVV